MMRSSITSNSLMVPLAMTLLTTLFLAPKCWFLSSELDRLADEGNMLYVLNHELERAGTILLEENRRNNVAITSLTTERDQLQRKIGGLEDDVSKHSEDVRMLRNEKYAKEEAMKKAEDEAKSEMEKLKDQLENVKREKGAAEDARREEERARMDAELTRRIAEEARWKAEDAKKEAEEARRRADAARAKAEQRANDKEEEAKAARVKAEQLVREKEIEARINLEKKQLDEAKAALSKGAEKKAETQEVEKPKEEAEKPKEEEAKPKARRLLWSLLRNS